MWSHLWEGHLYFWHIDCLEDYVLTKKFTRELGTLPTGGPYTLINDKGKYIDI